MSSLAVLVPNPVPGGAGYAIAACVQRAGFEAHVTLDAELQAGLLRSKAFSSITTIRAPRNTLPMGLGARPNTADECRYLKELLDVCRTSRIRYVLVSTEPDAVFFSRNRAAFLKEGVDPLVPPAELFEQLCDKYNVVQLADRFGFPTPRTVLITQGHEVPCAIHAAGGLPVVLKRRVGMGSAFVRLARSMAEAQLCFAALATEGFESIIVQEYIPGGQERSFNYILSGGRTVAQFGLLKPHHLRPSYSISVVVMDEVLELTKGEALLKGIGYDGAAVIQTAFDKRDGQHKIIEINARFGNNARILIGAGIDVPAWLILAKEGQLEAVPTAALRGRAAFCPVESAVLLTRTLLNRNSSAENQPSAGQMLASFVRLLRRRPALDGNTKRLLLEPGAAYRAIAGGLRVKPIPVGPDYPFRQIPWGDLMC